MVTKLNSGFHHSSDMTTHSWNQNNSLLNLNPNDLNTATERAVFGQFPKGPDPYHPAYIFGERVLRPTIDISYNLGHHIFTLLKGGYASLDNFLSQFFNFIPGVQATSTDSGTADSCKLPGGSYLDSCEDTKLETYVSEDPNIPQGICKLTTKCASMFAALPKQENELYFDERSSLILGNQNGTLVIQNENKKEVLISDLSKVVCNPLPGSHHDSCEVSAAPYLSSDVKLKNTPFCQMTSECLTLDWENIEHNQIYFGYEELRESDVAVENCNGFLVLHETKKSDGSCANKHPDTIVQIQQEKGKNCHVFPI